MGLEVGSYDRSVFDILYGATALKKRKCSDPTHTEKNADGGCKLCKRFRERARAQTPEGKLRARLSSIKYRKTQHGREKHAAATRLYYKRHPQRVKNLMRRLNGLPLPTRPSPTACELCGGPPRIKPTLVLDHCHTTGVFRGWLCSPCNLSLGHLGDTAAAAKRALDYLIRSGDQSSTQESVNPTELKTYSNG